MAELRQVTEIEKQVYGTAAVAVRERLAKLRGGASPVILDALQDLATELSVTVPVMIAAWQTVIAVRMPEVDFSDLVSDPTAKTEAIRAVDKVLEEAGVVESERDELTGFMETNTEVPEPTE